ncbi:unnamed protein product [Absidia cylindrospora]
MPKIVSSSTVSSSNFDDNQNDQRQKLQIYYCLCSEFLMVIDAELQLLPRRKSDNAIIVTIANVLTNSLQNQNNRRDGFEKQYRYHCPRCELLIAYEMKEERKSDHYTYIVDAALTNVQGIAPPSALLEPTEVK